MQSGTIPSVLQAVKGDRHSWILSRGVGVQSKAADDELCQNRNQKQSSIASSDHLPVQASQLSVVHLDLPIDTIAPELVQRRQVITAPALPWVTILARQGSARKDLLEARKECCFALSCLLRRSGRGGLEERAARSSGRGVGWRGRGGSAVRHRVCA